MMASVRRPRHQLPATARHVCLRGRPLDGEARDIAAGAREAGDEAVADRIDCSREDDRNIPGGLLGGQNRRRTDRHDDIDLQPNELGRNVPKAFAAAFRPPVLKATLLPSIQPNSRSRCANAAVPLILRQRVARSQIADGRDASGFAAPAPETTMMLLCSQVPR